MVFTGGLDRPRWALIEMAVKVMSTWHRGKP